MDHMRIFGTEPSSVILSQTNYINRLKCDAWVIPKTEAKRDGVIKPQNTIWPILFTEYFMFSKRF